MSEGASDPVASGALDLDRYEALYRALGVPTARAGGHLWRVYQRMAVPVGPAAWDYRLAPGEARALLKALPSALLVRETGGFDDPSGGGAGEGTERPWYVVAASSPFNDRILGHDMRKLTRRATRSLVVGRIPAASLALRMGPVLRAATDRYARRTPFLSGVWGAAEVGLGGEFEDLVQFWGVYADERLVAYARVLIVGTSEVFIEESHFDPAARRLRPMYALIPALQTHYLGDCGVSMLSGGARTLLHETRMQDLYLTGFRWNRVGFRDLQLTYRPSLGAAMAAVRLGGGMARRVAARVDPRLGALLLQDQIAREYR